MAAQPPACGPSSLALLRLLFLLLLADPTYPQSVNFAPSPPPLDNETVVLPFNTSVSFFNVGSCRTVQAVKFEFEDPLCPLIYRVGKKCHVPGPYGRQVYVTFTGRVEYLDIILLNPAEDDVNLTVTERVYLSTDQRRNFVGAYLQPHVGIDACGSGFTVIPPGETGAGEIRPRYFRSMFRHAALDVGSADVISNGDSTIATLGVGQAIALDQLLVTAEDMPTPIGISFATELGGVAAEALPAEPRLWGSTCEQTATGFVLFGRPTADLPLRVLRLDGTAEVCAYDEATTAKFTVEVAFYNTVATDVSLTFAFGLSPFLPYSSLQMSEPLSWTARDSGESTQPGELWVKIVDASTGSVVVLSQRVPINRQRRNLIGASLGDCATCFQLDMLQADNETHTAPAVAPAHFRLIFAHAALTMPPAIVRANDDIELFSVAPGSRNHLDHPLLPPHQEGRLLKISFDTGGHSSNTYSTLIDTSRLCDGAAYAVVLIGTQDRLDLYDPVLITVKGTPTECTLSGASVTSGASSTLALLNAAPHAASARFEWGSTLLSLTRRSVPLSFRAVEVTDVPVGQLFVRLLRPDPPYEPLTSIRIVEVHEQARNALVARAVGNNESLTWRLDDLTSDADPIASGNVRLLLVNTYEDAGGAGRAAAASVSGIISEGVSLAPNVAVPIDYSVDGGLSVRFSESGGGELGGAPAEIPFGEACAESLQLIVLSGVRGATSGGALDATPAHQHIDAANGYCRIIIPTIPEREVFETATTQPPTTTTTLDIFGPGGPGGGPFLQDSPAAPSHQQARSQHLWLMLSLLLTSTLSLLLSLVIVPDLSD